MVTYELLEKLTTKYFIYITLKMIEILILELLLYIQINKRLWSKKRQKEILFMLLRLKV